MGAYSYRNLVGATAVTLILIAPQTVLAADVSNTATGTNALSVNTGTNNSAFGNSALFSNILGSENTAVGYQALYFSNDFENTAVGYQALYNNTNGGANTANGRQALYSNTSGFQNTANGDLALFYNNGGYLNTAAGSAALYHNVSGYENTANGEESLYSMNGGWGNTAMGYQALNNNTAGHNNVALGYQAGTNLKGSNNVAIQNAGNSGDNNTIRIGDAQSKTFIAGISGVTASGGVQVYINSSGQLGTLTSSQRFKKEIKSIDGVSDKLLQLRPVSFIYKEDESNQMQYGLIAEEVAKVYPELVQYDKEGKPFTVYYNLLTPLLLSALQKEHTLNDAQQAKLESQQEKLSVQQTQLADLQTVAAKQQAKLELQEQQLSTQHAEMLAVLQQQKQQLAEMTALQQKFNQLDELLQVNDSNRSSSAKVAVALSH